MKAKFTCVIPFKEALLDEKFGSEESTLSLSVKHPVSDVEATSHVITASSNRVLVVEDHPISAMVLKAILETMDCKIDVAANGNTALQFIQDNLYDLIFMDIGLPDIDGYEVTKRIRSNKIAIPIIALTAHVDEESTHQCLSMGMNMIVSKPLSREKLAAILKTFISEKK